MRAFLISLILCALSGGAVAAEAVNVHGSTTVVKYLIEPNQKFLDDSSVKLTVVPNGSGKGLGDLIDGKAQIAMISSELKLVADALAKKSGTPVDTTGLVTHQIDVVSLAFIVHPSNSVKELTLKDIARILLGDVTTWAQLGGADRPIKVVSEPAGGGIRSMVEADLLNRKPMGPSILLQEVPGALEVGQTVAADPDAIGLATTGSVSPSVAVLVTDATLFQPLILVTKGQPTGDVAAVVAALKEAVKQK